MNKKEIKILVRRYEEYLKNADPMEPLDFGFLEDPGEEWEFLNKMKMLEGQENYFCLNYNSKIYGHDEYLLKIAKEYIGEDNFYEIMDEYKEKCEKAWKAIPDNYNF